MKSDSKKEVLTDYYFESFDTLVKRVSRRAGGVAQAEDVVQNAFLRAIVYLNNYNPEKDFAGWFNGILFNELKRFSAIERSSGMSHDDEELTDSLEHTVYTGVLTEDIMKEVEEMPEKQREIIKRFVFLGDSGKSIARGLKVNIHTIRKTVQNFYTDVRARYDL